MNKSEMFDENLKELARLTHHGTPYTDSKTSVFGQNQNMHFGQHILPLSRTTISQHLRELKEIGLIHGKIEGLRFKYYIFSGNIEKYLELFEAFFEKVKETAVDCKI